MPHFAPKAKHVIYLLQNGAPTHVDLFDYKPEHGEVPRAGAARVVPQEPAAQHHDRRPEAEAGAPADHRLQAARRSAAPGSATFCRTRRRSPTTSASSSRCTPTQVNHAPAITFFLTGAELPGRPSMGAWLTYGLGSETEDLPGFVVMTSRDKEASCGQIFYDFYWGSGFLPSRFQGVKFRGSGDPVLYLSNPDGMSREVRRGLLDDLARLNELKLRGVRRPRDRHAHRPVRDGLPDAGQRPGADRFLDRARTASSTCTAPTCSGRARSPTTA